MTYEFPMPFCEDIWQLKYQFKDHHTGEVYDQTVEDTWRRVARALSVCEYADSRQHLSRLESEKCMETWEGRFYGAMADWRFLPAGRILAGAGTNRNITLFNCYVMGTIEDDLASIFNHLKEAALTMQQGGGIGYDFSTLRPRGAEVKRVGADASGPLPFMDTWDAMCATIMSAGTRRGAMMATLRCDHPDIEAFIEAKSDPKRLRMFNMSVLCTDAFMEAVKNDDDWVLVFNGEPYKTVRAKELWQKIMRSTYDYAEPGVIYIDRINNSNNLREVETIAATNPCGEQPLPPYGACLLGSINLAKFIIDPFGRRPKLDVDGITDVVQTAVRMLDNVNDSSLFPLEAQKVEAQSKRRIGLGVTGLADALAMSKLIYGSELSIQFTRRLMEKIANIAYRTSAEIAEEKGCFPLFNADIFLDPGTFASRLAPNTKKIINEKGMRNSHLLSIAPTGTISMFGGNVSSGIEPIFALEYERKVTRRDGSKTTEQVKDYAVHLFQKMYPGEPLPNYFVTAQDLPPEAHVKMQCVAQQWIDSSISKTINLPKNISFEDFQQVYMDTYEGGGKGCTTYRPNDVTGSVISVKETENVKTESPTPKESVIHVLDRPEYVIGATYKLKFPHEEHALYLTVNDIEIDGRRQPFEVFINSKNMEHYAWTVALTRMISGVFRRGGDVSFVAEELRAVFDPRGGGFVDGRYQPSILALIGCTLEKHMKSIGYLKDTETVSKEENALPSDQAGNAKLMNRNVLLCPKCFSSNYKHEGGCLSCGDCGHSSCN